MMDEVLCYDCGEHLCWTYYSGSMGMFFCDECKETEETLSADPDDLTE